MEQQHQEYVDYYRVRYEKVANHPKYPFTAHAERELYEAIAGAPSLEAFGEILQARGLNVKCAVARIRDNYTARARFYTELEETVRAGAALEILHHLETTEYTDVMALQSMVSDVETRWMNRISSDEHLIEEFWGDWKVLEDIECAEYAPVPERWKEKRRRLNAQEIARGIEAWRTRTLPEMRKFDPAYVPDHDLLRAPRHRRKVPVYDGAFERRILGHKNYLGVTSHAR
ncbi:hypothetical protein KJ975_02545 [Myxococcota bacterium]|nr:hypothetical protein [Myxococcota bacterium]